MKWLTYFENFKLNLPTRSIGEGLLNGYSCTLLAGMQNDTLLMGGNLVTSSKVTYTQNLGSISPKADPAISFHVQMGN